jgi:hypothetical protein
MGVGRGAKGARAGPGRTGPCHFADRNPRHARPSNRLQSQTKNRDGTRRTRNIRQRNVLRHDATPMTLRFWFIHDTDTCHHTGLKLGRRSETGREKRVTPEFGERKEEKKSTPKFRALQPLTSALTSAANCSVVRGTVQSTVARRSCCSAGSPDSPVAHRTVR